MIAVEINGSTEEAFVDTGSDNNLLTVGKAKELNIAYLEIDSIEIKPTTLVGLKGA